MDRANNLGPAILGTLNGTGFMNRKPGNYAGYVQDTGTFIVADASREEVEALKGDALIYSGPVEGRDARVTDCYIDSVEDFPTITFYTNSGETSL